MSCNACTLTQTRPHCGAYRMQCLECCTRLVLKTRPSKTLAAGMLAAIERSKLAPSRETVLQAVRAAQVARKPSGQG